MSVSIGKMIDKYENRKHYKFDDNNSFFCLPNDW